MQLNWKDKTILVVDDTEINFVLIKTQLRKNSPNMIWIKNGHDAIEYIKDHEEIDLILMDIRMPVMDGIQATIKIKEIAPEIPIIIQTASVMGDAYEEISRSGCDDVIFKPIVASKLIKIIDKQFNKKSNK